MKKTVIAAMGAVVLIGGCATKPADIPASYVSPLTYEKYSCAQLSEEAQRVSSEAARVTGVQKKAATRDAVATGVGVIVFWPALFFIKGGGANEAEVAKLKGEMNTIERVSNQKKCGISFKRA